VATHFSPHADFFSERKTKSPYTFLPRNFFAGRANRTFFQKPGSVQNFTTEKNPGSQVRTRYPGNYPVNQYLLHTSFSREKENCRIAAGRFTEF